jgi:ribosomal protein S27AE
MKEIIEILEERYSPEEIWELFDNYDEDQLRDYFIKNDICPLCGNELFVHRWEENREWWGSIVKEPLSELRCSNCGETF